jgi:hypothetical protein
MEVTIITKSHYDPAEMHEREAVGRSASGRVPCAYLKVTCFTRREQQGDCLSSQAFCTEHLKMWVDRDWTLSIRVFWHVSHCLCSSSSIVRMSLQYSDFTYAMFTSSYGCGMS